MTRLADPIEGVWWLPEARRRTRQGVLQQLPTGHFELTLRTAWRHEVMKAVDQAECITLLGKAQDGRPISLSAGFLTEHNRPMPESSPAIFHFDRAFLGAHFPEEDGAVLTELRARIPVLDHWLGISGLEIDLLRPKRELAIHFSQPEDLEFELEPGLKLVFGFDWQGPALRRPQLEALLRQEVWLILRSSPARSFGELETSFKRILDLFSLFVGEALGYESLVGEMSRAGRRSQEVAELTRVDIFFAPIAPELVGKVVEGRRMLLRFSDVQSKNPNIFQCWLDKYKVYRSAFEPYFAVQRRDPAYQEQRFLSVVQSLEALHRLSDQNPPSEEHQEKLKRIEECLSSKDRKWLKGKLRHSHEPNLCSRLENLLEPFGGLFGDSEERHRFAESIANTRNYLTHYDPSMENKAVKPSRLTPYIFRLKVLFVLHCLLQLGLTPDEARQHIEKNHRLLKMVQFGKA